MIRVITTKGHSQEPAREHPARAASPFSTVVPRERGRAKQSVGLDGVAPGNGEGVLGEISVNKLGATGRLPTVAEGYFRAGYPWAVSTAPGARKGSYN